MNASRHVMRRRSSLVFGSKIKGSQIWPRQIHVHIHTHTPSIIHAYAHTHVCIIHTDACISSRVFVPTASRNASMALCNVFQGFWSFQKHGRHARLKGSVHSAACVKKNSTAAFALEVDFTVYIFSLAQAGRYIQGIVTLHQTLHQGTVVRFSLTCTSHIMFGHACIHGCM